MAVERFPFKVREYRLTLNVDFQGKSWTGSIDFDLEGVANSIDLDSLRLTIDRATVDGKPVPVENDPENERIRLAAPVRGRARIGVDFSGAVGEHSLMGLYRSRYGEGYILTTQCEATSAREIFPCLDRPDVKAPIRLTVRAARDLEVVSNTAPETVVEEGPLRRWEFAPTPPMATYLFYLGVGVFEHLNGKAGRIALSVLTPPGRSPEGHKALDVTRIALEELEKYYRIPYPLPKLDLIAVPEFPAGAMENWGAITFRDMQLLVNDQTPAFELRYTVATIVHELAHQWFGNLVTPYWWTDIWLNESFATFVEHKVVERRFPELQSEYDFLSIWTRWGFLLDSVSPNHPIVVEVHNTSEIANAIDRLTYGKGASVLRMVEGYLGSERFESGVADYLQRHAWGNASSDDLWEALDRASSEPITRILRPWIEKASHPVVSAELGPGGLALRQRPYGYRPPDSDTVWPIPMVIEIDGKVQRLLFDTPQRTVPCPTGATVHLNKEALGFYRTLYSPELYERLYRGFAQRSPTDRWIVLEDLWAFLLSGEIDLATFGRFVRALDGATDYLCVGSIAAHLETLHAWSGNLEPVLTLSRGFLRAQFDRIGLDPRPGESSTDGSLRAAVVHALVACDPEFAARLAPEFQRWKGLDANLQPAVAEAFASTGGRAAFEKIQEALASARTETEIRRLEFALAQTNDVGCAAQVLELALSGKFNKGHLGGLLTAASTNPVARNLTWDWLEQHFPLVQERLHGTTLLQDMLDLSIPALGIFNPERVRAYFREHPLVGNEKAVARSLGMLEVAEGLVQRLTQGPTGAAAPRNASGRSERSADPER